MNRVCRAASHALRNRSVKCTDSRRIHSKCVQSPGPSSLHEPLLPQSQASEIRYAQILLNVDFLFTPFRPFDVNIALLGHMFAREKIISQRLLRYICFCEARLGCGRQKIKFVNQRVRDVFTTRRCDWKSVVQQPLRDPAL